MPDLRQTVYNKLFVGAGTSNRLSLVNLTLVILILSAVAVSVIGTEPTITGKHHDLIIGIEMGFGVIFLAEYVARLWSVAERPGPGSATSKRLRFIFSPLAIIDLIVVLTSLAPFFIGDAAMLRLIRLVRILALTKFTRFSHAIEEISAAVWGRRYELIVTIALAWVLLLLGAVAMYWAEGAAQPEQFGSIPRALWWAIVTLTTVGYGDAIPITPLGKITAAIVALGGVALVAMPAGIMAAAFSDAMQKKRELELARRIEQEVEEKVEEEIERLMDVEESRRDT
ncbi:ion transporter [Erythrobacter sp. SG61-1L]|uniref:ion transporter n=1 Tax=Erythrobacter sp. SG61-1L TaxID=1603897 RepID=UPI0006C91988|nr:ion transporter [Erythrobacter sp. SG61-1L]